MEDERDLPLSLDQQLCFALYSASRALTNLYRTLLDELGLTYPQYLVMLVLWERRTVSVKALCAALRLDSGTVSPLIKRLESAGMVTRIRSADDERSVEVTLTADGLRLRESARTVPARMLEATGIEPGDVRELRSVVERLTANVDAATEQARTGAGVRPSGEGNAGT